MTQATAPGKLILCGEHAVVYGRPAIALPLGDVRAHVKVADGPPGSGLILEALDIRQRWTDSENSTHPLVELVTNLLRDLTSKPHPDLVIQISSSIPIAGGMGSGAAVATALVRTLSRHFNQELTPQDISTRVYASEQRLHGTPSGIDNTVIAFEQPIWFQRNSATSGQKSTPPTMEPVTIATPFTLLIGDTGVRSPTREPVGAVRQRWQADRSRYETLFDEIGALVTQTRDALSCGNLEILGELLNHNHILLQSLGVSSPELDRLVQAARASGATAAKLSGAGWGGVMFALITAETSAAVGAALRAAGATRVLQTTVTQHSIG